MAPGTAIKPGRVSTVVRKEAHSMPKEARIDLRAEPEVVERLKEAAQKDRRSLTQFLVHYGLAEADRILGPTVQSRD